jgi:hypothetical protein
MEIAQLLATYRMTRTTGRNVSISIPVTWKPVTDGNLYLSYTDAATVTLTVGPVGDTFRMAEFWLFADAGAKGSASLRWHTASNFRFGCPSQPVQEINTVTAFRIVSDDSYLYVAERRVYPNGSFTSGLYHSYPSYFDSRAIVNNRRIAAGPPPGSVSIHAPSMATYNHGPTGLPALPHHPQGAFLGVDNTGPRVIFSYDNGATWSTNDGPGALSSIDSIAANRYNSYVVVVGTGSNTTFYKSDGLVFGSSWSGTGVMPTYGGPRLPHLVDTSTTAAMHFIAWYDGGSTQNIDYLPSLAGWSARTAWTPSAKTTVSAAADNIRGYVMLISDDGYVSVSGNQGSSWNGGLVRAIDTGALSITSLVITFIPAWRRWLVVGNTGTSSYVTWSDDDGTTWSSPALVPNYILFPSPGGSFGAFDDVVYIGDGTAGSLPIYHLSYDGGVTWRQFNSPNGDKAGSTPNTIVHSLSDNRLLTICQSGDTYISDNGILSP